MPSKHPFKHPKHLLKPMDKKIITILRRLFLLIWPYENVSISHSKSPSFGNADNFAECNFLRGALGNIFQHGLRSHCFDHSYYGSWSDWDFSRGYMEKKLRIVRAWVLILLSAIFVDKVRMVTYFVMMFFIGRESTVTGFCFHAMNIKSIR